MASKAPENSEYVKAGTKETAAAAALAVELHNKLRFEHNAPPLKLDSSLSEQAEEYAMSIAKGAKPSHICDESGLGWNAFRIMTAGPGYERYGPKEGVTAAIITWYDYNKAYNWRDPLSSSKVARQFSQVIPVFYSKKREPIVWKSADTFGIGVVTRLEDGGSRKMTVVVTLYQPTGNLRSDQSCFQNVLRPRGSKGAILR